MSPAQGSANLPLKVDDSGGSDCGPKVSPTQGSAHLPLKVDDSDGSDYGPVAGTPDSPEFRRRLLNTSD